MTSWSSMPERVSAYLRTRRALGFTLRIEGRQLERFARFAEQLDHHGPLTLELAVAWANASRTPEGLGPARRLEVLRPFAAYCRLFEAQTQIPPARLFGPAHRRLTPYIYTDQELAQLLAATADLHPSGGLRPITMRTLLGLLAATGLRVGEALRLTDADFDLQQQLLRIRESKFRKSRLVPLQTSTTEALAEYVAVRNRRLGQTAAPALFLFDDGCPVNGVQARYAFRQLRQRLGRDQRGNGPVPRLYDLRHRFVCRRLLTWYADGVDVNRMLPQLATYLGHAKVSATYWYLTAIPELMAVAAERFERAATATEEDRPWA
jgi:integrase/recombinase XerD